MLLFSLKLVELHVVIGTFSTSVDTFSRMTYEDSKPTMPKPKAVAGVQGTKITVEDLFYNVPSRKKTITNYTEEYHKIVDVVKKYAINNSGTVFTCKKVNR